LGYPELRDIAGAFGVFLVIILIYVFQLDARGRKLRKELERVRKRVGSDKRD
jgi:hypothetical protein